MTQDLPPGVDVSKVSELWPVIKDLLTLVIIPYLAWNFKINKEMNDKMDKNNEKANEKMDNIKTDVKMVNTTLVGQDGRNGLRSRFNKMEAKVEGIMMAMSRSGMTIRSEDVKSEEPD